MSEDEGTRPSPRYCFDCAAMLKPGARFCPDCGAATDGSRPRIAPPTPPPPMVILPPPQYQAAPPRRAPFETFMLTITGMSALGIFAILVAPLLICIGLTLVCVIGGIGVANMPTPTPYRP